MKSIVSGLVLEHHRKADKADSSKIYNTLIVYEFGKPFPELIRINVRPEKVAEIGPLVGQQVDLEVEVSIFNQRASLSYLAARASASRRAA